MTGAAYSGAEGAIREFVLGNKLPFLPTPMGKGMLPDDDPLCVAPARSRSVGVRGQILIYTYSYGGSLLR